MIRLFLSVLLVFLVCVTAQAQPQAATSAPAITSEQARSALDILNDPAKRAAFASTLNAIVKAQGTNPAAAPAATAKSPPPATPSGAPGTAPGNPPGSPPAEPPAKPPTTTLVEGVNIPLAPDSLGAELLLSASSFANRMGEQTIAALDAVQSIPLLYGWMIVMATNEVARNLLFDVAWRAAVVIACAFLTEWLLSRAMRRPVAAVEALGPAGNGSSNHDATQDDERDDDGVARAEAGEVEPPARHRPNAWALLRRVPLVVGRLLLELVPVFGIVAVGHFLAASSLGGQTATRVIILALVDAYAACMALLCVARMLLSPTSARLRLFHLQDSTSVYLMMWIRRLVLIIVIGYAVGEVGLLLGLSDLAHDALQKTVGLIVHIALVVFVIKNRRHVRQWLRAPEGDTSATARIRNLFARIWHWIALFFLIAGWLVWAVEIPHGYAALVHYFFITALIMIGARLTLILLLGVVDRTMRPPSEGRTPHRIQARLQAYHPIVVSILRAIVYIFAVLGLLQIYGLNTLLWLLTSNLGLRLLSSAATLLVTIGMALLVWETVNGAFQQHLDRLQREAQIARSARLRTLLPLLRTTLLITITVVAVLMVLSEIGINVAPLLAGAGIVGVAIGFGSQKLVQDLITGIFLLLENAMQVGDQVTVSGLQGTVENLSVRTIRLRASDGSVHIIPFSSVTSVTNVNRGLGNASVAVTIPFDEDVDRAADALKAVGNDMRQDPDMSAKMLSDLQLWGVDKVDGASVTLAGQIVCTDSGRWAVQREFNRRMKQRFQSLGIRIYSPVQTIILERDYEPEAAPHRSASDGGDSGPTEQRG
jgi:moderate conductance mechanosensitive channel